MKKKKTFFYYKRLEKRSHYIKKFNWLQNKQKIRRKNFHKQNSKKQKIKTNMIETGTDQDKKLKNK